MKTETYIRAAIAALMIFSLFSCRKTWDYIKDHPKTELKFCNIKKITNPAGSSLKEAEFTYNSDGNPVKITRKTGTGYFSFTEFRYDNKGRLVKFLHHSGDEIQTYEELHVLAYDNKNNIFLDSTYEGYYLKDDVHDPFHPHPQGTDYPTRLDSFTYDNKGRIKAVHNIEWQGSREPELIPAPWFFTYNSGGNLNRDFPVTYDNKVNLLRTNKIWQFLERDYSVNNPFTADNYNCYGLPLEVGVGYLPLVTWYSYKPGAKVEYMCNCDNTSSLK